MTRFRSPYATQEGPAGSRSVPVVFRPLRTVTRFARSSTARPLMQKLWRCAPEQDWLVLPYEASRSPKARISRRWRLFGRVSGGW